MAKAIQTLLLRGYIKLQSLSMRHVTVAESGPLARLRLQMLQNSESRMFMLRVLKPCQCEIATDELEIRYGKNVQRAAISKRA